MCFRCHSDFKLWSLVPWNSVNLSSFFPRPPQLTASVWVWKDLSPAHKSAICSEFLTYLCNSPSFCQRPLNSTHAVFLGELLRTGECCWLDDACVQLRGPSRSFMTPSKRSSVEMGFVELESNRNWTVIVGILCRGRRQWKRRGTQVN